MKRIYLSKSDNIGEAPDGYEVLGFNINGDVVKSNDSPILNKITKVGYLSTESFDFLSGGVTEGKTTTYLLCNGSTDGIKIGKDTTCFYEVTITGVKRNDNSSPAYYIETYTGLISNYDGNTFLINVDQNNYFESVAAPMKRTETSSVRKNETSKSNSGYIVFDSIRMNQGSNSTEGVSTLLSTKSSKSSLFIEVTGLSGSNVQWSAKTKFQLISNNSLSVTASNIKQVGYVYSGINFLDDERFRPTDTQLDHYGVAIGSDVSGEIDAKFREGENSYLISQNELLINQYISPKYYDKLPSFPERTIYNNGPLKTIKCQWWPEYLSDLNLYNSDVEISSNQNFINIWTTPSNLTNYWFEPSVETGLRPSDVMPGVNKINMLPMTSVVPTKGNPGDVLPVITQGESAVEELDESTIKSLPNYTFYAWDEENSEFSSTFYNNYFRNSYEMRERNRNNQLRSLNEFILTMKDFIWTSEYLPSYRVKKDLNSTQIKDTVVGKAISRIKKSQ